MTDNNAQKRYHPAFRGLSWGVPLAALAVIAAFLLFGEEEEKGRGVEVSPPAPAGIQNTGFAQIDSIIADATEAFEKRDYDESARLLSRARFFIHTGISERRLDVMPRNLELILGLSEFYRGYPLKGILLVTCAAEVEPRNETYAWYLGLMHLSEGNNKDARKYLERAAALGGIYSDSSGKILEEM